MPELLVAGGGYYLQPTDSIRDILASKIGVENLSPNTMSELVVSGIKSGQRYVIKPTESALGHGVMIAMPVDSSPELLGLSALDDGNSHEPWLNFLRQNNRGYSYRDNI